MKIAITGTSGIVGRFALRAMLDAGHQVTPLGRHTGYELGDAPDLSGHEALIHCAFAHAPGRYRGGEGDDPEGFRKANLTGTIRLFDAASDSGVSRILFLSSRAVYDGHARDVDLTDDLPAFPANLYGEVKALAEDHLHSLGLVGCAIRATGVYGPGLAHKWQGLFRDYLEGRPIEPRIATEVHGHDLAQAMLLLTQGKPPPVVNVSDLILDRHDLLDEVQRLTGSPHPLPPAADASRLRVMRCDRLIGMGWQPGGFNLLRTSLPAMLNSGADM